MEKQIFIERDIDKETEKVKDFLTSEEKEYFKNKIEESMEDFEDLTEAGVPSRFKSAEEWRMYHEKLLDPQEIKKSIDNLEPLPEEVFNLYSEDDLEKIKKLIEEGKQESIDEITVRQGNFYIMFDQTPTPAIMRFWFKHPDEAKKIHKTVRALREKRREVGCDRSDENKKEIAKLFQSVPWDRVCAAYNEVSKLIDRRDINLKIEPSGSTMGELEIKARDYLKS